MENGECPTLYHDTLVSILLSFENRLTENKFSWSLSLAPCQCTDSPKCILETQSVFFQTGQTQVAAQTEVRSEEKTSRSATEDKHGEDQRSPGKLPAKVNGFWCRAASSANVLERMILKFT